MVFALKLFLASSISPEYTRPEFKVSPEYLFTSYAEEDSRLRVPRWIRSAHERRGTHPITRPRLHTVHQGKSGPGLSGLPLNIHAHEASASIFAFLWRLAYDEPRFPKLPFHNPFLVATR